MKTIIAKSIMMVIVIIAMVHYALYLKTGRIPWEGWQTPKLSLPTDLAKAKNVLPGSKTRVYTWVDDNGVTHYSQEPPPAHITGRELEVDAANVNVMQSVAVPERDDEVRTQGTITGGGERTPLEKAQEAAALLEAREMKQKKILDSI